MWEVSHEFERGIREFWLFLVRKPKQKQSEETKSPEAEEEHEKNLCLLPKRNNNE